MLKQQDFEMKGELRILRLSREVKRDLQPSPMGEGGVHKAQPHGEKLPRMCGQVSNGREWALRSKTVKTPHSADALFN